MQAIWRIYSLDTCLISIYLDRLRGLSRSVNCGFSDIGIFQIIDCKPWRDTLERKRNLPESSILGINTFETIGKDVLYKTLKVTVETLKTFSDFKFLRGNTSFSSSPRKQLLVKFDEIR